MSDVSSRAHNAMIGLAIGDALSWPALFHRSMLLPPWTRRIRREMDAASETTHVIAMPMPFSLNQDAEHFAIGPTDETEWAAFSAEILLKQNFQSYDKSVLKEWNTLAQSADAVRGGVSTQAALHNLRNGILPPQSGKENPHYFDDGALSRAIPIGVLCAGQPEAAARLANIDASVTNSEDGVWAAQAIAVVVSMVCSGDTLDNAIIESKKFLPEGSWIKRIVEQAMQIGEKSESLFAILPELHTTIVNREYSYGNVAPETLALTFTLAKFHQDNYETAISAATTFAKSGESLPAIVGAVVGAMHTSVIGNDQWLSAVGTLKGICIPSFAGKDYLSLSNRISTLAGKKIRL